MITFTSSAAAGLLALASFCSAMAVPHTIDPRAPHFAEIMIPEPDYLLIANTSAGGNESIAFQYRNGERAYETTMQVSIVGSGGNESFVLASNVSFYNSYYVNATLTINYTQIPDGNYTLVAAEILENGDIYQETGQPFGISHDPKAVAPTGEMSDIDPSATSTSGTSSSSAYILQPSSEPTLTASRGSLGLTDISQSADSNVQSTTAVASGNIEQNLENLVEKLQGSV